MRNYAENSRRMEQQKEYRRRKQLKKLQRNIFLVNIPPQNLPFQDYWPTLSAYFPDRGNCFGQSVRSPDSTIPQGSVAAMEPEKSG